MFVYCLFGSLWKSSLMSVVCVLAFCSNGNLRGICNFSAVYYYLFPCIIYPRVVLVANKITNLQHSYSTACLVQMGTPSLT